MHIRKSKSREKSQRNKRIQKRLFLQVKMCQIQWFKNENFPIIKIQTQYVVVNFY